VGGPYLLCSDVHIPNDNDMGQLVMVVLGEMSIRLDYLSAELLCVSEPRPLSDICFVIFFLLSCGFSSNFLGCVL
jgi:hypothetical protein